LDPAVLINNPEPETALRFELAPEIALVFPPLTHVAAGIVCAPAVVPDAPETVVELTSVFPEGVEKLTL
jgi:hypothetical protein